MATTPLTDLQTIARSTDVRYRRTTNTGDLCQKLANMRDDALAFASDPVIGPGVMYSLATRLDNLIAELRGQR